MDWASIYCLILLSPPILGLVAIVKIGKWSIRTGNAIHSRAEAEFVEKENIKAWRLLERKHNWKTNNPYESDQEEYDPPPF